MQGEECNVEAARRHSTRPFQKAVWQNETMLKHAFTVVVLKDGVSIVHVLQMIPVHDIVK